MPPLHAGRPSCRRAKRGEGRGAPPSPSGLRAAGRSEQAPGRLRRAVSGGRSRGGRTVDGRLAGEATAPSRPRGAGGPHRAQAQVGRGRLPSAGGRGHWALASPACPVPRPCRAPVPSGGGITPREFAALAPALPGASEPFRQVPPSSSEGSALPGPARPCPAHPGTPTTSCGRPRRLALDLGGLWLPGTHALSARRDWTEKQPSTWLTQAWAPQLGSRKCGLSAGATSHPLCGPSWLGPPPQAQREGERRAGGPG